jgi:heme exporter protein CcmD
MGGYGGYVWPCYAVTVIVLGAAIVLCIKAHARSLAELRRLEDEAR